MWAGVRGHSILVQVHVVTVPLSIQLPDHGLGKEVKDALDAWVPITHVGDP